MYRVILLLSLAIPALAQTGSPDTQLTQALLTEIRQLRHDLQTAAATIQRVQIVMFRLQTENAAVNRATQRLDDARRNCNSTQNQRKFMSSEIDRLEQVLRTTQNPVERKTTEDNLPRVKSNIEMLNAQEEQCHAAESDADAQVRVARARLSELEDQLDKLDKVLAGVGK